MRRGYVVVGCLLVAVVVVAGIWLWIAAQPSGDPGGRVLNQLTPATVALPPDANVAYRNDVEPRWDSCDGRPGTFGWDDVVVEVHFKTATPESRLVANADTALRRLGWLPDRNFAIGASWTKVLSNGTTARASLDYVAGEDAWTLFVVAPPVGQRSSGC